MEQLTQWFDELWQQMKTAWDSTPYAAYVALTFAGLTLLLFVLTLINWVGKRKARADAAAQRARVLELTASGEVSLRSAREDAERRVEELKRAAAERERSFELSKSELNTRIQGLGDTLAQEARDHEAELTKLREEFEREKQRMQVEFAGTITRISSTPPTPALAPIAGHAEPAPLPERRPEVPRIVSAPPPKPVNLDFTDVERHLEMAGTELVQLQDAVSVPHEEFNEESMTTAFEFASNAARHLGDARQELAALRAMAM